jgi:hypothetical protein
MRCKDVVRHVDSGLAMTWRVRMHFWICTPCTKYRRFSNHLRELLEAFRTAPANAENLNRKLLSKFL